MEKQLRMEETNYYIRKVYLETMKQFMADDQTACYSQANADIEAYLLYEKQVSHHLQELFAESDFKIFHHASSGGSSM